MIISVNKPENGNGAKGGFIYYRLQIRLNITSSILIPYWYFRYEIFVDLSSEYSSFLYSFS